MSKRDILRAAKAAGLKITDANWNWSPTPGESIPVWSIYFDPDSADEFGIEAFREFANSIEAVEWIRALSPTVNPK